MDLVAKPPNTRGRARGSGADRLLGRASAGRAGRSRGWRRFARGLREVKSFSVDNQAVGSRTMVVEERDVGCCAGETALATEESVPGPGTDTGESRVGINVRVRRPAAPRMRIRPSSC